MSEVKTVTHEGKVYQIGQDYLFRNNGSSLTYSKLENIIFSDAYPFKTVNCNFKYIEKVPSSKNLGTITPAPIELDNGNAYTFDYGCIGNRVGVYHKETDRFYFAMAHVPVSACTNIRLMTVGSE
jgi:hypothetical protein